jgi:hypothetical protein
MNGMVLMRKVSTTTAKRKERVGITLLRRGVGLYAGTSKVKEVFLTRLVLLGCVA